MQAGKAKPRGRSPSRFVILAEALSTLLLGCTNTIPAEVMRPADAADPASTVEPAPEECNASSFEPTEDGVLWSIGGEQVRFRASEQTGELAYNYRRRAVRIEAVDAGSAFIESDCYTETDCNAPPDADGKQRWCLVSNGLEGTHTLFELIAPHRPCESPIDLLEALAVHSTSPTCFRAALGTYAGFPYDELGPLSQLMADEGVPVDVITAVEAHAKAAADADQGDRDPHAEAASAAELHELRRAIAPYTTTSAAWQLDLSALRALAQLERRYPYTIVGPDESFHDVLSSDEDPWRTTPTAPPWAHDDPRGP